VLANLKEVDETIVIERTDFSKLGANIMTALTLRKRKFAVSITTFPSNRTWYNIFAFIIGAEKRITHSYSFGRFRTLAFLQNYREPAVVNLHTIDQNLNLLKHLGIYPSGPKDISLPLTDEQEYSGKVFLNKNNIDENLPIIGVHPSIVSSAPYKNWSTANIRRFTGLITWLLENLKAKVILFTGGDEKAAAYNIAEPLRGRITVCEEPDILRVASIIKRCRLFVNTDSGLGHLAVAVGVRTVTIFGPANPKISGPYGTQNAIIVPEEQCCPCYEYPFNSCRPVVRCGADAKCMREIDIDRVKREIAKALK
jgi:ADP-heptose:LPS heptosyltransferase